MNLLDIALRSMTATGNLKLYMVNLPSSISTPMTMKSAHRLYKTPFDHQGTSMSPHRYECFSQTDLRSPQMHTVHRPPSNAHLPFCRSLLDLLHRHRTISMTKSSLRYLPVPAVRESSGLSHQPVKYQYPNRPSLLNRLRRKQTLRFLLTCSHIIQRNLPLNPSSLSPYPQHLPLWNASTKRN